VTKKLGDDAKSVGFEAVDCLVVLDERLFKQLGPEPIQLAKSLADAAVELFKGPLLRATFDDHGWQLRLLSGRKIDLHQLVHSFLKQA